MDLKPLAACLCILGCAPPQESRVTVLNQRDVTISALSVSVNSTSFAAESLAPGDSVSWRWVAKDDDHYVIRFRVDSSEVVDSFGYVTSGAAFDDLIRIRTETVLYKARTPRE
jgi:hypothetical protein